MPEYEKKVCDRCGIYARHILHIGTHFNDFAMRTKCNFKSRIEIAIPNKWNPPPEWVKNETT